MTGKYIDLLDEMLPPPTKISKRHLRYKTVTHCNGLIYVLSMVSITICTIIMYLTSTRLNTLFLVKTNF